jgi:NAD-dependent deacetylase sirtuin 4
MGLDPWPDGSRGPSHGCRVWSRYLLGVDRRVGAGATIETSTRAVPALAGAEGVRALTGLLLGRRVVALVGAGCSTASGIPDYRGPETRRRARNPIQIQAFLGDDAGRRRYWARAVVGWPLFRASQPNAAHAALAALEHAGVLRGIITQNVDRLHQAAGSHRVVELHGALHEVVCLQCGHTEPRDAVQQRLLALNPGWDDGGWQAAPDGDAELPVELVEGFRVVGCERCNGVIKPKVVFFGENVPADVTARAWSLFEEGEVLLVVGSSLTVFSGYRFVRRAAKEGMPVALVNLGPTRGDADATLRVDDRVEAVLPAVARALG